MYLIALLIVTIIDLFFIIQNRETIRPLNIVIIGVLLYLAFCVRNTPDINNYILRFQLDYQGHDYGFIYVSHFFRDLGLNYYQFQFLYYYLAISLMVIGLINITPHRLLVYILYFFFPFFLNLVQLRNFMVFAILIFATGYCHKNSNQINSKIVWCLLILLAASQHIVALAYLPFAFCWNNKKVLNIIIIGSLIISVFLLISPDEFVQVFTNLIEQIIDEDRASTYSVRSTHFGSVVMVVEAILMIVIAKYSAYFINETRFQINATDSNYIVNSTHFIFIINLLYYSSVFWPLYFLNGSFSRLMQNEFVLVYVFIAYVVRILISISRNKKESLNMNYYIVSLFSFVLLFIYNMKTLWFDLYDEVILPILNDAF